MAGNEVGYWQVSPGRLSIRPRNLTQQCQEIFWEEPRWPDAEAFDHKYNGLRQNATRVIYSMGSQDPWTWVRRANRIDSAYRERPGNRIL
jgi:hypothetical protein